MSAPLAFAGPNAEQIRYWNEIAGPRWVAHQERLDRMIGELGDRAIEHAQPAAGESVIDVGCGCGTTTLELARRVGPSGSALGIDLSAPMLEVARSRTAAANVRFANADAQTHPFEPASADLVFSRFGVMFFADPTAAFRNLRRALRPSGRLAFLCWQAMSQNEWVTVPVGAIARVVPLPPPPAPDAPGPFAFGDRTRVAGILAGAGFADIAFTPLTETVWIGGRGATLDEAAAFAIQLGPAGAAYREAAPEQRDRIAAAIRETLAARFVEGGVPMQGAAWVVTARPQR